MKTMKFFSILFILTIVSFSTKAQKISGEDTFDVKYTAGEVECLGETIIGEITFNWWFLGYKYQEKVSGTFIGETSRDYYTLDWTYNDGSHFNQKEGNFGSTLTMKLRREGKLVGNVHITYHWTVNGDGDLRAEVDKYQFDCK
jgi:hypothetical protein